MFTKKSTVTKVVPYFYYYCHPRMTYVPLEE